MRTFINLITKINVFGFNQGRVVVVAGCERSAHAAQHLSKWHARRRSDCSRRTTKRDLQSFADGVALAIESMHSYMAGPRLCPQPVRRVSHVSVDA